jgi:hypothetical protein
MKQADRLLGQMSREFGAVDGDVCVEIGKQFARAAGDARQWHTNRARNVTARVGLCRQHIDHRECASLEPSAKFIAGNGRNLRGGRRGFSFGRHRSKSAASAAAPDDHSLCQAVRQAARSASLGHSEGGGSVVQAGEYSFLADDLDNTVAH